MADDNEILAFLDFCRQMTRDDRIAVIVSYRPKWTVNQIAEACGVSGRTILRSDTYRRLRRMQKSRPGRPSQRRGRLGRQHNTVDRDEGFSDPDDSAA